MAGTFAYDRPEQAPIEEPFDIYAWLHNVTDTLNEQIDLLSDQLKISEVRYNDIESRLQLAKMMLDAIGKQRLAWQERNADAPDAPALRAKPVLIR